MARKSRKKTGSAVCVSTSPAVKPFSTAIYARLSVENSGKNDDGDSIENQVSICREYIEESDGYDQGRKNQYRCLQGSQPLRS